MRYEGKGENYVHHTSYLIPLTLPGCLLLAWLYGRAVQLPFFFDDLNQIPYAGAQTLRQLWAADGGFTYYRPLGSTIWHVAAHWWGTDSAPWLHGLNLLLHLVNGLLLARLGEMLAARQPRPRLTWRGGAAAVLFWLYPFSYQAVPWIGALFHLLVTTLALASLFCYVQASLTGRRVWTFLGLGLALLAPFAHENGLLIAPLALLLGWTQGQPKARLWRDGLVWLMPAAVWFMVRFWGVNSSGAAPVLQNAETMGQNMAYFIQGIAFPWTAGGGWLRDRLGVNDIAAALGLSLLGLGIAAVVQRRTRAGRAALWSWGWAFLAVLPAIPLLEFGYVISGPRLLMLASAGACWLWADVLARLGGLVAGQRPPVWWRAGGAAALCLLLCAQNAAFVRLRMQQHAMLGQAVRQATAHTLAANAAGSPAYILNIPSWIAPSHTVYPLGHEGITFLPGYIPAVALLQAQVSQPLRVDLLRYTDLKPEMPYYYEVAGGGLDWDHLNATGGLFFLTTFAPDAIDVRLAGGINAQPASGPSVAVFTPPGGEPALTLARTAAAWDGQEAVITLQWQAFSAISQPAAVFVHAIDQAGQLIGQADGVAIAGIYPFALWSPHAVVSDVRYVPLPASPHAIAIGLYDPASGERWRAYQPNGQLWPDGAVTIEMP